jgi:hypothetical protein
MLTRIRLPLSFDPDPLLADVAGLDPVDWIPHFNTGYYEGDWSGVALRSIAGRPTQLYPDVAASEPYADSPILARCPNLRRAIGRFECELLSARLLRLGAGAAIREHSDHKLGYDDGEVRIHVPLTTSTQVGFLHDGELVEMRAGEAWYLDLNLPHAVANRGTSERVHLVIDCVVNPWLDGMLAAGTGRSTGPRRAASPPRVPVPDPPLTPRSTPAPRGSPLAVPQLERLRRSIVGEPGRPPEPRSAHEFATTRAVLDCLGVGLEPVHRYLSWKMPTPTEFEQWILSETGGVIDPGRVARANAIADGSPPDAARVAELERLERAAPVLSAADLAFWEENGYVIVRSAAPADACRTLERAIWQHLGANPDDPDSWYGLELQQGIMVQLFHAPGIAEIHASPRIHKAFAQLWGTPDLVMSTDRCSFNAPVRDGCPYTGTKLHLDLESVEPPISPSLQGILYLTDTDEHQGAFRCVPGFHCRIDAWLASLPWDRDPRLEDLEALGPRSIAARGGDLIIWSAALPHGSQPNTGVRPRIAHYLRMYPPPRPAGSADVT